MKTCDACGEEQAVLTIGSAALCKTCANDVSLEMTKLQSEGENPDAMEIARRIFNHTHICIKK